MPAPSLSLSCPDTSPHGAHPLCAEATHAETIRHLLAKVLSVQREVGNARAGHSTLTDLHTTNSQGEHEKEQVMVEGPLGVLVSLESRPFYILGDLIRLLFLTFHFDLSLHFFSALDKL